MSNKENPDEFGATFNLEEHLESVKTGRFLNNFRFYLAGGNARVWLSPNRIEAFTEEQVSRLR
jgi:hypothetical protein